MLQPEDGRMKVRRTHLSAISAMADDESIGQRKLDHIALCADEDVEYRTTTTLLEQVTLVHDSLPELAVDEISLATTFVGRALPTPLMISGMTGGPDSAGAINRELARVAEELGLAFGLGSQRPMLGDRDSWSTFQVRDVAPTAFLCGNIGFVQAAALSAEQLTELVEAVGADALCIHINPAQELIQERGDRDFRGCLDGLAAAVEGLSVPVIAKETGNGMSASVTKRLANAGVRAVDVSGAGGTTWVGVEALRATDESASVGAALWDWGIPTAPSVVFAADQGLEVIASGGIRSGLDGARALALGASVASAALPFLRAAVEGGAERALGVGQGMLRTLRSSMLLTGSRDLDALRKAPRLLGPDLERWLTLRDAG